MATLSFNEFDHFRARLSGVEIHALIGGAGEPLVLLHGFPQHSLMWHTVAPLLASRFKVIAPDLRGMGASSIPPGGYDKKTMASDIAGLLDALNIGSAFIAGYDLGAGVASAFARDYPGRVKKLAVMEFGLPGFGYEQMMAPQPDWTINSNWHLGIFTIPDVGEWLFKGREAEMLSWFFQHISYSGNSVVSMNHFAQYVRELQKPAALRAGINLYAAVWQDAKDNAPLKERPLAMPVLAIGGEASAGEVVRQIWSPVASNLQTAVIKKAGHFLGDENPKELAAVLERFFA